MYTTKQTIESMLKNLPDDCSVEDIQYHLYVLEKSLQGLASHQPQEMFTHEEVEGLMKKWLIK